MKLHSKFSHLMIIGFLFLKPVAAVATVQSFISLGEKAEQIIIKNGDFNDGLNDWVISNPEANNPNIETDVNGNNYAQASNGESILQYVPLKPNTTYQFTYYAKIAYGFPAVVEFGTLNHDEGFKPLKEEKHSDTAWKQHEFIFTTPAQENTYTIRFASSGNGTAYFDNIQATPLDLEAPTAPSNLKVTGATTNSVSLSWEASTDNVGVTGYLIYRDGKKITEVAGNVLAYTNTGLAEDTEYSYEVKAIDQAGNQSLASNTVTARTLKTEDTEAPTAPLNLKVTGVTASSVSLSWEASTDNVGVTGYLIYRDGQKIDEVAGNVLAYTNTGLAEDTEYSYEVKAIDQAGNQSLASNTVTARTLKTEDTEAPTAPLNLKVTGVTASSVSLSWEASTDNVGVTGYLIYRDGQKIDEVAGNVLAYTNTGLAEDTEYSYEVKAIDQAGNQSLASNTVTARTNANQDVNTPLPPAGLKAAKVMEDKVVLMWTAPTDPTGVSAYQVYRDGILVGSATGDALTYTDTGLKENTKYRYTVKTKNALGNLSKESNSIVVQTTKKAGVPLVPEQIDPTYVTNNTAHNTKQNNVPEKVSVQSNVAKKILATLPLTGSLVYPNIRFVGIVIVEITGWIILRSFRNRKKV